MTAPEVPIGSLYPYTEMPIAGASQDTACDFIVACEDFLLSFGYSTARNYRNDLEVWLEWCVCQARRVDPLHPASADIQRFLADHLAEGYSPNTVARRLTALRGLYGRMGEGENVAESVAPVPRRRGWTV